MKTAILYFILGLYVMLTSCDSNPKIKGYPEVVVLKKKTFKPLKESYHEEDISVNEYLAERLKPIRQNFNRINSITQWASVDTIDLWESTEGGEARFYYSNGNLEKIVTRNFGEMGQWLTEYYLLDNRLSFVFEKSYKYNKPFYDSSTTVKSGYIETFDPEKSEVIEDRSYFNHGKLIHQLNNQDCGSPFADEYLLEEQKRIITDYAKLVKLADNH